MIGVNLPKSMNVKFFEYHKANPQIYSYFERFAREALRAGFDHYSAKAIFERVRWHVTIETKRSDGFKLNNNYTSRYARMLEKTNPEFEGFFRMRELRS